LDAPSVIQWKVRAVQLLQALVLDNHQVGVSHPVACQR
jgi:hypothetical protein